MKTNVKMKFVIVVVIICSGAFAASYAFSGKGLGHGYRLIDREVDTSDPKRYPNAFEGIAHYADLYLGTHRIGKEVGNYSISPSGNFALFEQIDQLLLFDRHSKKTIVVTDGEYALIEDVVWNESKHQVKVTYYEGGAKKHAPSVIKLPIH